MSYVTYLIAFGLTLQLLLTLIRLAPRIGLVDQPGGRKVHQGAIPLVGGLAMFVGFSFSLLTLDQPLGPLRAMMAGGMLLVLVGVLDDFRELSSSSRFLVQIGASLLMVYWGGVELLDLGYLVSVDSLIELGVWSVPLTVFATVGVINGLNMVDGVDGLAGSVTAVSVISLIVVAQHGGAGDAVAVLGALLAAIAGFLVLNMRWPWQSRARVFMGDAGSMFLGFVLAWYLIDFAQGEDRLISPATALWLLGIPLIDTVTQMLRRIIRRRSPFAPDREHFHHFLILAGYTPVTALLIMTSVSVVMALVGLLAHYRGVPESTMFFAFLALFSVYFLMISRVWQVRRFFNRVIERRGTGDRRGTQAVYSGEERRMGRERRRRGD